MSRRRAERAASAARQAEEANPDLVTAHWFEHPVYGHVVYRKRAGRIVRVRWFTAEFGKNWWSPQWDPEGFQEILDKLGIEA
ncbi:hypothetical protein [Zhihengliuella halotolerans]|uniref:hypothetical protein n=1 Tax=Zhihengliuella halotolerans TaxID=370736 RepID=UPI0011AF9FA4|nr:hypothetical protein [Zhihengliuella halotolerans]